MTPEKGDTKTDAALRVAAEGSRSDIPADRCCNTKTQNLILDVAERIINVEDEVEELKNNPDVVDIVDTYADLQAYDTSGLTDKDIIRVLADETHSGKSTYYRWDVTDQEFDFVGEISGGGVNVVQTTGASTSDVMSQDATTKMVFKNGVTSSVCIGDNADSNVTFVGTAVGSSSRGTGKQAVGVGYNARGDGDYSIAVGPSAYASQVEGVAIGHNANANGTSSVAIGSGASANYKKGAIAIGVGSNPSSVGEFNIGSAYDTSCGYNNSNYRLLTGLYDGQNSHDAVTKGQLDSVVIQNAGAPTTATAGTVGMILEDTTNGKLYICTAVDTTDPQNPSYTWAEVGSGGGGGSGVIDLTTADYDYPTATPDGVALWKLDAGVYRNSTGSAIKTYYGTNKVLNLQDGKSFLALPNKGGSKVYIYYYDSSYDKPQFVMARESTLGKVYDMLTLNHLRDQLNYTDPGTDALDAHQGYVLDQKITPITASGAPTTATQGDVGKVYIDTDSGTAYMCVSASGGTYTWKQITA